MIGHHDHLLTARQVDPNNRIRRWHQGAWPFQPSVAVAVTPRNATTVTHELPPAAWDTKPEAHQGTFLRHAPTRSTSFYAAEQSGALRALVLGLPGAGSVSFTPWQSIWVRPA
jgi:hypothetical protein